MFQTLHLLKILFPLYSKRFYPFLLLIQSRGKVDFFSPGDEPGGYYFLLQLKAPFCCLAPRLLKTSRVVLSAVSPHPQIYDLPVSACTKDAHAS